MILEIIIRQKHTHTNNVVNNSHYNKNHVFQMSTADHFLGCIFDVNLTETVFEIIHWEWYKIHSTALVTEFILMLGMAAA